MSFKALIGNAALELTREDKVMGHFAFQKLLDQRMFEKHLKAETEQATDGCFIHCAAFEAKFYPLKECHVAVDS